MDVLQDGSEKRRILCELSRCLKTVFVEASTSKCGNVRLTVNCVLIQCIDRALQHGLLNLLHGYWPLVRGCSHAQTLQTIDSWVGSQSSHRVKGKAWLLATLVEGSLLSYLQCILSEPRTIEHLYAPHAILRDHSSVSQLSSLLTGLESINFLAEETIDFNQESTIICGVEENASAIVKPLLELSLNGGHGVLGTTMTSSMTSSLASPGDSGFTQLDSETDTASFSEIVLEADSTSVREDVAVLPVDPCTEKTIGGSHAVEQMTVSDITNANASSGSMNAKPSDDVDEVIYRKHKTKDGKASSIKQQKRVSFHECTAGLSPNENHGDSFTTAKEVERMSSSLKASATHLSFKYEQEGVEIAEDSSVLGHDGIEELFMKTPCCTQILSHNAFGVESYLHSVKSVMLGKTSQRNDVKAPVTERGIPEGQEDPPLRCSVSTTISYHPPVSACEQKSTSNSSSPAPSFSSLKPQISTPLRLANESDSSSTAPPGTPNSVLSQTPSKACLVKRFLRSITQKKISSGRSAAAIAAWNKKSSSIRKLKLYIDGVTPIDSLAQELLDELREEMEQHSQELVHPSTHTNHPVEITPSLNNFLHTQLKLSDNEAIHKILRVRDTSVSGSGTRLKLLAVITNEALYIISSEMLRLDFVAHSGLSTILIGPNSQWISFIASCKSHPVSLLMNGDNTTSELVSTIELALRRKGQKSSSLPVVVHLQEEIFKTPQWTSVLQGERVHNYSVVHAFEETPSPPNVISAPIMKAYFMFRTCESKANSSWEPGFFVLKAGVLHVLPDEEATSPRYSIHLHGVTCHPIPHSSRPHTIEVSFLHIAAPDNHVAHDWLDALHKSSMEVFDDNTSDRKLSIICGSLLLTENRLLLIDSIGIPNKDLHKLSKPLLSAFVSEVTSLRIGSKGSCWCIVEFSCREVHESGGDYVVFFGSCGDRLSFMESLGQLRSALTQNTTVLPESDSFAQYCDRIAAELSSGLNLEGL